MNLPKDIANKLRDTQKAYRKGYGKGLPSNLDFAFADVCKFFINSPLESRLILLNEISQESRLLIIGFSDRFSTIAARMNDQEYLRLALTSHLIEDFRYDPRENILRLSLLSHVCGKIGVSESNLFGSLINLASNHAATHLKSFQNRPLENKCIKSMRIIEVNGDCGVSYKYSY